MNYVDRARLHERARARSEPRDRSETCKSKVKSIEGPERHDYADGKALSTEAGNKLSKLLDRVFGAEQHAALCFDGCQQSASRALCTVIQ
eukprot:1189546-Prorocentrum_minimum.AAC.2